MKSLLIRVAVAIGLVGVTLAFALTGPRPVASEEVGVVMRVPANSLGGLRAEFDQPVQRYMAAEEKVWLPVDTEVVRQSYWTLGNWSRREKGVSFLRVGVVLAGADSRSLHRPEICLPGQGWTIVREEYRTVPVGDLGEVEVKALTLKQEVHIEGEAYYLQAQYWYWWEGPDQQTASTTERTILQMLEALHSKRVTRWAYPSVFAQVPLGLDLSDQELAARTEASMAEALAEWAPQVLTRMGAKPLTDREQKRAAKEEVEPEIEGVSAGDDL